MRITPPDGCPFRPVQSICEMWVRQFEADWQAAPQADLAAGDLQLNVVAALSMAGSSIIVAVDALLLKRLRLPQSPAP